MYQDETLICENCGKEIIYNENKTLTGNGFKFPFKNVGEWYDYQVDYINKLDVNEFNDTPAYTETVRFIKVFSDKAKIVLSVNASISLYGDRYEVVINNKTRIFEFKDISAVTVLGRNKMDFYYKDEIYQVKGGKRFNALKYMFFFYRKKNMEEEKNDTFLGLWLLGRYKYVRRIIARLNSGTRIKRKSKILKKNSLEQSILQKLQKQLNNLNLFWYLISIPQNEQ